MAENITRIERTTEYDYRTTDKPLSRLSWGGIFIGMFATLALSVLFLSLGAAIGLSAIDFTGGGGSWFVGGIGSAIWALLSFVVATFFGAWVASRASRLYFKSDAWAEGMAVWALSLVAVLILGAAFTGFAVRTTTALTSATLEAAGAAAQAGGQALSQDQINALQQQLQAALPGAAQAEAAGIEAAETATTATAAAAWWFFITGALSLAAGIFGGIAGIKSKAKAEEPVRYPVTLRPQQHRTA